MKACRHSPGVLGILVLLAVLSPEATAWADVLLDDQFDGPGIDPGWVFSYSDYYAGSNIGINAGRLYVDSMTSNAYGPNGGFKYASVTLERAITPATDFSAEMNLHWRQDRAAMMARAHVILYDAAGREVAGMEYEDGWANPADLDGAGYFSIFAGDGIHTQPRWGWPNWGRDLSFNMTRSGSSFTASFLSDGFAPWGGYFSGASTTAPIVKASIRLGFYAYDGNVGFGISYPSTLWVDSLRVTGVAVPEPTSLALGFVGLLGLALMRTSRRAA